MSQQAQAMVQTQQKTAEQASTKGSMLQRAAVIPAITPVHSGILQRCSGGVECEECRQKRLGMIQRAAVNSAPVNGNGVPPIVHDTLSSPGQPLDAGTRAFMEPRFGHDFSQVRVHMDDRAAESARAVNALAYTVGRDVVFGTGQYTPGTSEGRRLMAHELTHVVQQSSAGPVGKGSLVVSDQMSEYEYEADIVADEMDSGRTVGITPLGQLSLQREEIPVDLVPTSTKEQEEAKRLGINLPVVSDEVWRAIGGVADNAGKTLSEIEKKKIEALLKLSVPTPTPIASPLGPRFLLHDTSSPVGSAAIKQEEVLGRGPLGKGVSAWVPRTGEATIARPNFYETRRPTTTAYEKAEDIIEQAPRETAFRQVWKAANATERANALNNALAGQNLDPKEIAAEKKGAESQLNASTGKIFTTASWAVGEICSKVGSVGAKGIAVPSKETDLTNGCTTLAPYFSERNLRVGSLVTVEIVQVGVKSDTGNKNTCDPANPNIIPIPDPPYTDSQYANVVSLYLRGALLAGRFPEITTHFAVDEFSREGHCDPRCFNLTKLYDLIAATLGHGKGSTYGIKPSYGIKQKTNNVWWHDTMCHGSHP